MSSELYVIGIAFAVLSGLVGVIWHMLNAKIDKGDSSTPPMVEELKRTFKEELSRIGADLRTHLNEQIANHNMRLSNGSLRMDDMQKEIASMRVRLAEDYHSAMETRQLITDFVTPLREQLNRMEYMLLGKRDQSGEHRG